MAFSLGSRTSGALQPRRLGGKATATRAWAGYTVLGTVLRAIERSVPRDVTSTADLRTHLIQVAAVARGRLSESFREGSGPAAERNRFIAYVEGLGDHVAARLAPLPYRCVLKPGERSRLIARLRQHWPSESESWHPGEAVTRSVPVLFLATAWFEHGVSIPDLRRRIATSGPTRICELNEGSPR